MKSFFLVVLVFFLGSITAGAQVPRSYKLRPGDAIEVQVFRHPELTRTLTLPPDGKMFYPFVGELAVGGLTLSELAARITKALQPELNRPMVSLNLVKQRTDEVNVLGSVTKPGRVTLGESWKLLDLLGACGGLVTAHPEWTKALLVRGRDGITLPLDLKKLLREGDAEQNPPVFSGDTLLINDIDPTTISVRVLGEVGKPGVSITPSDNSLAILIASAGGFGPRAALSRVKLVRDGKTYGLDFSQWMKSGAYKATGPDGAALPELKLAAGDTLLVPTTKERFAVMGAVGRPGVMDFPESEKVTLIDALSMAGGPVPSANLKKAHLIRSSENGIPDATELNLEDILSGKSPTLGKMPLELRRCARCGSQGAEELLYLARCDERCHLPVHDLPLNPAMYRRNHIAYRLIDAFFRSWALFTLVFLGTAGVVTGALLMRGNTYVASASIRVVPENEVSEIMGFQQRNWVNPSDQSVARFNDLMRNMLPGGFVDKALQGAQLTRPIQIDSTDKDTRFGALRKAIYAASTSKDVFTIGIVWDDPDEAERIIASLQARFIEDAGMAKQLSSGRVTAYLDTEIKGVEGRMRRAEQAVIDFKKTHQGQLPTAQASITARLQTLEEERSLLYATSEDSSTKRQAVEERLRNVSPTSILSQTRRMETPIALEIRALERKRRDMVMADAYKSDLAEIDTELERLRQQEQDLRLKSGGVAETQYQDNPEYTDLQMQLTNLKGEERARIARMNHLNEQAGQAPGRGCPVPRCSSAP
ncbi:MAG: SLBB domain-containing protein [Armatimonas sp.]